MKCYVPFFRVDITLNAANSHQSLYAVVHRSAQRNSLTVGGLNEQYSWTMLDLIYPSEKFGDPYREEKCRHQEDPAEH